MKKILIIGGGIFGCTIAIELANSYNVTLIEKESDILTKASKCNHNRIHYGYHYPRSLETANQSLEGIMLFQHYYKDAIVSNFENYYAIAKYNNKINTYEYTKFCDMAGIPYEEKYPSENIINYELIENCYKVNEPIYDVEILKTIIHSKLNKINVLLNTEYNINMESEYDHIINCSYSNINVINNLFKIENINIKYQDVVIPIFKYNHNKIGLTIMDGNYCSIMPRGVNNNEFLLYSVKHSILNESNFPILNNEINSNKMNRDF